jgi:AraC-like DNA-binding protein
MERAELLLITTDMPIKSISDALGYEEVSYFNRLFKDKIGKTPLNYRMGKQIQ